MKEHKCMQGQLKKFKIKENIQIPDKEGEHLALLI